MTDTTTFITANTFSDLSQWDKEALVSDLVQAGDARVSCRINWEQDGAGEYPVYYGTFVAPEGDKGLIWDYAPASEILAEIGLNKAD